MKLKSPGNILSLTLIITFLSWTILTQGNSLILQGTFEIKPTSEIPLEVNEILRGSKSFVICALVCVKRRWLNSFPCLAYEFNPLDRTCVLYKKGATNNMLTSRARVFWFKVKDVFHRVEVGGQLFSIYLSSVKKTYSEARTHCHDLGSYLLEVRTPKIYDAVNVVVKGSTGLAFVGCNDIAAEGQFVYDRDGSPIPEEALRWHGREGVNPRRDENCLLLAFLSLELLDGSCSLNHLFLCQRDI